MRTKFTGTKLTKGTQCVDIMDKMTKSRELWDRVIDRTSFKGIERGSRSHGERSNETFSLKESGVALESKLRKKGSVDDDIRVYHKEEYRSSVRALKVRKLIRDG